MFLENKDLPWHSRVLVCSISFAIAWVAGCFGWSLIK